MKDVIIGIDAGTSVIKSVAFDLNGRQIESHSIPNSYETLPGGGSVQDMSRTWSDTAETVRGLIQKLPDLASRVAAISVTGQGDGTWLIDKNGEPSGPGWLWLDARAASLVNELRSSQEDEARFNITATGLASCQQGPQLKWMQQNDPDLLHRSKFAMHCKDWLYFKLTGRVGTDPSEGNFSFGDFRTRQYNDDVIEFFGLKKFKHLIPEMIDGAAEYDALSPEASRQTGLLQGTPVTLGFVDVICTALGAGLYEENADIGCTVVGSTGMHMRLVPDPGAVELNSARTGYTMQMPIPGVLAQMQSNMASTLNIDWLLDVAVDLLGSLGIEKSRPDLIPHIDRWLAEAKPASTIYQPYISEAGERGPFVDENARAGFTGLSTKHRFGDLLRSVVEGIAFAGRDCYAAMGSTPSEIRVTGGAARSEQLRTVFGAVLHSNIRTSSRKEAGAAGAAMIAAVAIGQYPSMKACADDWVTPLLGDVEQPKPALTETYDAYFDSYLAARAALSPVWSAMATSRGTSV
ncbi:MAG: FGGY-family carbohydrate kinase [Stappiaceae bacterium]